MYVNQTAPILDYDLFFIKYMYIITGAKLKGKAAGMTQQFVTTCSYLLSDNSIRYCVFSAVLHTIIYLLCMSYDSKSYVI